MLSHIISSSIVIVAVFIIRAIFRNKIPNRMVYALWAIVFIRLVIPGTLFDVTLPSSITTTENTLTKLVTIETDHKADEYAQNENIINATENAKNPTINDSPTTNAKPSKIPSTDTTAKSENRSIDINTIIRAFYFSGVIVVGLWFIISELSVWRKLKRSRHFFKQHSRTKVYISDCAVSPCTFGIIPSIYVTSDIANSNQIDMVLMHEYSHVRQFDTFRSVLRLAVTAVFWFNPLVWAYMISASRDSELACDEIVTSRLDEIQRLSYAKMLLQYAPRAKGSASGFGGKPMKKRIIAITNKKQIRAISTTFAIILTLSVCTLGFIGCTEDTTNENSFENSSENEISTSESSIAESENSDSIVSTEQSENESLADVPLDLHDYNDVQKTAYDFFKAYVLGDIDKAKSLMDSPDNPYLEEFPTKSDSWCIGSMDQIESYYVELIRCVYNEESGITEVTVEIAYSDITDESIFYISIDLSSDDIKSGIWKINHFFEEA